MRVVFHMLPEPGHLNPTFSVARALVDRGHEVIYTSVLDLQPAIEARGFRCVPIHRDIVRRGKLADIEQLITAEERDLAWNQIRDRVHDEYFDGTIERVVRDLDPSLIAADVITLSPIQFVAHRLGIPWLALSTSLSQRHGGLPPISSSLLPTAREAELAAARWQGSGLRFLAFDRVAVAGAVAATFDTYAARFGYPSDQVSLDAEFNPALTVASELVLCPPALDFPRGDVPGPQHFAAAVDLDRVEQIPEPLEAFVARHPSVIYASLGSQSGRYPDAVRFFAAVIGALRAHPEWRAVISTGARFVNYPVFADLPDNVMILRSVPQLWLLRRAAAFVTHAGLGGITEAIALRVPMIAVPQMFDQLGNAARVAYHQIGIQLTADSVGGHALGMAIGRVLDQRAAYQARLTALHERCLADQADTAGLEMFERIGAADRAMLATPTIGTSPEPSPMGSGLGWMLVGPSGAVFLRRGAIVRDQRAELAVGVGLGGFTIASDLSTALMRAGGPLLARVEVSDERTTEGNLLCGRTLRCHWALDIAEPLYGFAAWCAERALEAERATAPEVVASFDQLIAHFHQQRRDGVQGDRLVELFRELFGCAAPSWERGWACAATAIAPSAHDAASGTRRLAIQQLSRAAAGVDAGTRDGAARFERTYHALSREFANELVRRIDDYVVASAVCRPAGETAEV